MSCSQPNLSSSWVNQVTTQGWGIMPIWVGTASTVLANGTNCGVCRNRSGGPCEDMDTDPNVATQQGTSEAVNAVDAALALGVNQSIIYYDMEAYTSDRVHGPCSPAVSAFINAWTQELHTLGFLAGVYGNRQMLPRIGQLVASARLPMLYGSMRPITRTRCGTQHKYRTVFGRITNAYISFVQTAQAFPVRNTATVTAE